MTELSQLEGKAFPGAPVSSKLVGDTAANVLSAEITDECLQTKSTDNLQQF